MARKEKRYHYIYKITCKITNKFYVGMHSTDNLEDGYMGSGIRLWRSISKHGKENHVCEILEFLSDRSSLKKREAEIVNEQFLQDPLCMNIMLGGGGGFISHEQQKHRSSCGGKTTWIKNRELHISLAKKGGNTTKKLGVGIFSKENKRRTGQTISEYQKQRISEVNSVKQKGEGNSQYGTCWITNGLENKKNKNNDPIPNGWIKGRINKKVN